MSDRENLKGAAELLKANWEIVQEIIGRLGDRSWKIKAWGLTIWWAVLGYSATSGLTALPLYLLGFLVVVFLMDCSVRVLEERFLDRSHEIEKALTAYAVGDAAGMAKCRVSTNVGMPKPKQMLELVTGRRFSFWAPYLGVALVTVAAYFVIR